MEELQRPTIPLQAQQVCVAAEPPQEPRYYPTEVHACITAQHYYYVNTIVRPSVNISVHVSDIWRQ